MPRRPQNPEFLSKFGRRLRAVREAQHMTQQRLADLLAMKPSTISLFESGDVSPTLSTLAVIARTLRVEASELLTFDQTVPAPIETNAEWELIEDYQSLSDDHKAIIRSMIRALKARG